MTQPIPENKTELTLAFHFTPRQVKPEPANSHAIFRIHQARTRGGGGGGSLLPMNPPRSFKFRFSINGMRAHCVRARFRDRSRPWFMHRIRMRRSFNFQRSDRCIARKTVLLGEASY